MIWPHVTKLNPCPICGKPDWCRFGEKLMLCMRVESERACEGGGWYHSYGDGRQTINLPTSIAQVKSVQTLNNAESLMKGWRAQTGDFDYELLADALSISESSLKAIGAALARPYSQLGRMIHPNAWAFPMKSPNGTTEGIRLRNMEGLKWAVSGSKSGLFMPDESVPKQDIVFLPEGPTDTAAALTMGLYAWGRPNCNSGTQTIREAMKIHGIRKAVIVADNDDLKQSGRPGKVGALKLKADLKMSSVIFFPPRKDLREYLKHGANYDCIMSLIKQKVWTI